MAKVAIDKTAPIALKACSRCGGQARLHYSRSHRWYVRCEKCKDMNKTEEIVSKLTACKLWNVRNKGEDHG